MMSPLALEAARALTGKAVAIIGLPRELSGPIGATLERARSGWQVFDHIPAIEQLSRFDLIVTAPAAAHDLAPAGKPLLLVGTIDALGETDATRDFVVAPPLNTDEVLVRTHQLLTRGTPRRRASGTAPLVLTADDDPTTLAIVRTVVTQAGFTCATAANGKQALERARELAPAVIVLDVNMPYLDGFEVLTSLRNDPQTASTPVVMLTSVQQEVDVLRGFALGATDYVSKPFNPMELLARVKRLVDKS